MTFFFSASPFAVWNYVNKARTSGCLYTPASGKKRRVETEVEREDMHGITNSNTARRLPNYICICCCLLHIRLVIKVDAPKKRMIFFLSSSSSSISITFLCPAVQAVSERRIRHEKKKKSELIGLRCRLRGKWKRYVWTGTIMKIKMCALIQLISSSFFVSGVVKCVICRMCDVMRAFAFAKYKKEC